MTLYLLGGFLGSGKTTAIQGACALLSETGMSAAVITNDQGAQLVDSAFLKGLRFPAREVTGGCFCCNYTQLEYSIRSLLQTDHPEVIFAESVGSCTDLVATIIKPLTRAYPDLKIVLSVFADAGLLEKGSRGLPLFSDDDLNYIYEKQLQEADVLVVNKADLLSDETGAMVAQWVAGKYSTGTVLYQNSLQKEDIRHWLQVLLDFRVPPERTSLDLDYDTYGAGEGKLAWLDEALVIETPDGRAVETGTALINQIFGNIRHHGCAIGHLKFLMQTDTWQRKISFTSTDEPSLKQTPHPMHLGSIRLLINARVQTTPGVLEEIVGSAKAALMREASCQITSTSFTVFKPGYPRPEHRIS